jgi:hypothetical protein
VDVPSPAYPKKPEPANVTIDNSSAILTAFSGATEGSSLSSSEPTAPH